MKEQNIDVDLKDRQKEILHLLLKFRFLNRIQIQALLHHKQFNRVIVWLNDLTEKGYLVRFYDRKIASLPAVYCLSNAGRKYFKFSLAYKNIHPALLNRIWRERNASAQFRDRRQFSTCHDTSGGSGGGA